MKRLMFALSACASTFAAAGQAPATTGELLVEHYNYSTPLDIARVVSMEAVPNTCEVVPMHMVYDDSKGQRHLLEYEVMGNGCVD
ncbi:DUF2790 domain-containing protein [Pseudomonas sp. RIT-PI-S]|uniref:DUF2790 domain-containing protein n=1 Tax=Pseudomonas sp. RIT-PI-S TaxID=3035295 RepID=UPI0021D9AB31|nr:DUF2790 domain-containing protein [Pseudomonas sp. RIT-PI-S]